MKPAVSLIPDREPVVIPPRPSLTPKARAEIFLAHEGRCGLCGEKIIGAYEIEHRIARGISGRDDRDNLYPAHPACHAKKTPADKAAIAKAKRLAGETCTAEPKRKLAGRGFGSVSRGFDGKVKLTKRAQREARANDDAPEGEGRAA